MKLYTDAACDNSLSIKERTMRIIVTDENGNVKVEKFKHGGSSNVGELWAICEAMFYAQSQSSNDLEIFTDSKNSLAWIKNGGAKSTVNDPESVGYLLSAICNLRCNGLQAKITWVPREKNMAGIFIEESA